MTDQEYIAALKAEMDAARAAFMESKRRYEAALIDRFWLKPGDLIRSEGGTIARMESVECVYGGIRCTAVLRNKDGNFGKRKAPLWRAEWHNPVKVEP